MKISSLRFVRLAAAVVPLLVGCSSADPRVSRDADGGVDAAQPTVADLIVVEEPTGFTTKSGGKASFRVRLGTQPSADVTMMVVNHRPDLAEAPVVRLVFTSDNWSEPRTITLTGLVDRPTDGDTSYSVQLGPTVSADPRFDGLRPPDVPILHVDDDHAGLVVTTPPGGLTTHESGTSDIFSVQLTERPRDPITVSLYSDEPTLGTVVPAELVFWPDTWKHPQRAEVHGKRDSIANGNVTYHVIAKIAGPTKDPAYRALRPKMVPVLSIDEDKVGFAVTPTSGLVTHQNDTGASATFTVALTSKPTANVTVSLSSSDTARGTVTPASLTFTAKDWNQPHEVALTGVDDKVAGPDLPFIIRLAPAISADSAYNGFDPPDVTATNVNTNRVGIRILDEAALVTTELGGTARFAIALTSRPTAPVTVPLISSEPDEGVPVIGSVVFQPDDWSTPHPVEVRGVADVFEDGDQLYAIHTGPASSADPGYHGFRGPAVFVRNLDAHAHYLTVTRLTFDADAIVEEATADLDKLVFRDRDHVYLLDVASGQRTLVSQSTTGRVGNGRSYFASLPRDGRFIAFTSYANNLVTGDTNGTYDVFLRDLQAGTTTRVSVGANGEEPTGASSSPSISDDGRWVAFSSRATNLVAGDSNGTGDIFIWDRTTGETTRMLGPGGVQPNGASSAPHLSADGRYVTFVSEASNLVANDTNGQLDVFVWDRSGNTIKRVNVSSTGAQCSLPSDHFLSISDDGQIIGFTSEDAATLDPPSASYEGERDGYIHDLRTGRTLRIVVGEDGTPLPHKAWAWNIVNVAANGRFVSFLHDQPAKTFVYDVDAARSRQVVLSGWDVLASIPSNDGKRVLLTARPESVTGAPYDLFIASRP